MTKEDADFWTGGCLCGGTSYSVSGALREICACNCRQCRKTSGHYVAATQAETEALEISGDTLRWYKSSDIAERGFCAVCGSNLFWRKFGSPLTSIMAGTLDNTGELRMTIQLYAEECAPYHQMPPLQQIVQTALRYEIPAD